MTLSEKNLIINGSFNFWQRGTTQTANGYGSADRWRVEYSGVTQAMSRQAFTVGQTDVPNNPKYYLRSVVGTGTGTEDWSLISQLIEDVKLSSEKVISYSFWAKADSNRDISIEFLQYFGVGGSARVVGIGTKKFNLTANWQKFTGTAIIPSISGKTTGAASQLRVWFWYSGGSLFDWRTDSLGNQSGVFDISQIQVEYGLDATEFETIPYDKELRLCQRYFQKLKVAGGVVNQYSPVYARMGTMTYPTVMRGTPSISNVSAASIGTHTGTVGTIYKYYQTTDHMAPIYNWTSGTYGYGSCHWSFSADLDAELS